MSDVDKAPLAPSDPAPLAPASGGVFRWVALGLAALVAGYLCWALEDLRQEAKTSGKAVNAHLPQILAKVDATSATVKEVSDDLKKLRDLAGASGPRDKSLAVFADRLLDMLEQAQVVVGVEKLIGKEISKPLAAADWVRDARKEALFLTFRAKSKAELFTRLCKNKFGSPWLVQGSEEGAKPEPLAAWFAARDPEAKELHAAEQAGE
ncbi:MAG TPA: hypothetical protein DEA08_20405 [Planctomycetes bacterium]|nr:hypothetical protein [Planctomycetota bacterium]